MKWYNYKDQWMNLEHCYGIILKPDRIRFVFPGDGNDYIEVYYKDNTERDAEFEKIKALMGIK